MTFTSDVEDTKRLCFVGQNGVQCGRAAAGLMGELTGGKGTVAIISGYRTNTSLSSRVSGFRSEMRKKYPGIEIIGPEYCFEENVRAREVAEKIFKEVPDLAGIYLTSHGSVKGREGDSWNEEIGSLKADDMVKALKEAGFAGIYIDRRAYLAEQIEQLESDLTEATGTKPVISDNGCLSFYKF